MEVKHSDGRFYIRTEHGEAELLYRVEGDIISMYHTFTPDDDRGKGIAEELAEAAFEFAIKKKLKVRPDCPYIGHFLEKHPEMRRYSV